MKTIVAFIIGISLVTGGCASKESEQQSSPTVVESEKNTTASTLERLTTLAFKAKLEKTTDAQVVDVRTLSETERGVIKNAFLMNLHDASFKENIKTLDKKKPVFVYCAGGVRSAKAAKIFQEEGFTEIYDLQEGFSSWTANGFEVAN